MRMALAGMVLALWAECLPPAECDRMYYADQRYEGTHWTDYGTYEPQWRTASGINVDYSGHPISGASLDALTDYVESCLGQPIRRCSLSVKVHEDFRQEPNGGQWFECVGNGRCSGVVEYPAIMVITPGLQAYRHELVHAVTHADHGSMEFECAN